MPAGALEPEFLYEFRAGAKDAHSATQWSAWATFGADPDEAPDVPSELNVSPCPGTTTAPPQLAQSLTPVLTATVDDQDSSNLEVLFEVRDGGGAIVASGAPAEWIPTGGVASFQVPADALQNASDYQFRVSGYDGTTRTWSDWKPFTVSVPTTFDPPTNLALTTCEGDCNLWHSNGAGAAFSANAASSAPAAGVTLKFEVRSDACTTGGKVPGVQPGASATWTMPVGKVKLGHPRGSCRGGRRKRRGVDRMAAVHHDGSRSTRRSTRPRPSSRNCGRSESQIDPTPTPEPSENVEDSEDTTPYTDDDLASLEADVDADRQRAVVQGVSENSPDLASRAVTIPMKYAPVSYIHHLEDRFPMSAATFINNSQLEWSHEGCNDHDLSNNVSQSKLGNGDYSHQSYWAACINHSGTRWKSTDRRAPFKSGGPWGEDGMNLDLLNSYRDGQGFGGDEPVYYIYEPGEYIEYFFHWGESSVPNKRPNFGKHGKGDRTSRSSSAPPISRFESSTGTTGSHANSRGQWCRSSTERTPD